MISINKYLATAFVASVFLSAAFAQTVPDVPFSGDKPVASTEAPVPQAGFIGGLGNKLIAGLKNAGKAVFSHVPFLNQASTTSAPSGEKTNAGTEAGETAATEAGETTATEAGETTATEAGETAATEAGEAASTEGPVTKAPATEAASAEAASTETAASSEAAAVEEPKAE